MNEIVKLYREHPVRIMEKDGEPWFMAKDVAAILGYSETAVMNRRLDDDEKTSLQILQDGSNYTTNVTYINESGLYNAILGSTKAEARSFKKWVTREVLPSIRKTGAYLSPAMTDDQMKSLVSTLEQEIYRRIDAENRLAEMERRTEQLAFQAIPKTPFGEVSRLTGRPRTRLIQNYLRSEREVKPKHFSDYVQLLLPLYASRELLVGLVEQYPMLEPAE